MCRRLAILLFSGAIALWATLAGAETADIHLLLSDSTTPYQQFSARFRESVERNGTGVQVTSSTVDSAEGANTTKASLLIAVGMEAAELALTRSGNMPVLVVMVPKAGYEALLDNHSARLGSRAVSAIYLDQPWDRQLGFIQAALPDHSTVGLLYSPDTPITLPRLPRGMSLNAQSVRSAENLFAVLDNVLGSSDVLLVVPDSKIYNSSSIRNILLTSYRHKVPLIGVSQAYVNAGALGAIYSTPEQLAEQAGDTAAFFLRSQRWPEPQHSVSFNIGLNQQVAYSLGITLEPPETIRRRMEKALEKRR